MLYLQLEQNPVPASRPRVTNFGVYYGKKYTEYRKNIHVPIRQAIKEAKAEGILPLNSSLLIAQLFEVQRPKTTKLDYPNPDLDNYNKALWDALQTHGVIEDDKRIIASIETKRWTTTTPTTHVLIQTVTLQDMKPAQVANPQTLLQDMMTGMATALAVVTTSKNQE